MMIPIHKNGKAQLEEALRSAFGPSKNSLAADINTLWHMINIAQGEIGRIGLEIHKSTGCYFTYRPPSPPIPVGVRLRTWDLWCNRITITHGPPFDQWYLTDVGKVRARNLDREQWQLHLAGHSLRSFIEKVTGQIEPPAVAAELVRIARAAGPEARIKIEDILVSDLFGVMEYADNPLVESALADLKSALEKLRVAIRLAK